MGEEGFGGASGKGDQEWFVPPLTRRATDGVVVGSEEDMGVGSGEAEGADAGEAGRRGGAVFGGVA